MSLVPSLLQAIVGVDGEALVMHAGDKPYVVAPSGQIELASRGLTLDAVNGIVSQLLPPDALSSLEEFGAIQQELASLPEFPGESFTVVAARGGDDVWVEIRRRKMSDDDLVPDDFFTSGATSAAGSGTAGDYAQQDLGDLQRPANPDYLDIDDVGPMGHPGRTDGMRHRDVAEDGSSEIPMDLGDLEIPGAAQLFENPVPVLVMEAVAHDEPAPFSTSLPVHEMALPAEIVVPDVVPEFTSWVPAVQDLPSPAAIIAPPPMIPPPPPEPVFMAPAPVVPVPVAPVEYPQPSVFDRPIIVPEPEPSAAVTPPPAAAVQFAPRPVEVPMPPPFVPPPVAPPPVASAPVPTAPAAEPVFRAAAPQPAVVLPTPRGPIRTDAPLPQIPAGVTGVDRLLRMAAACGASTLYLSSDARPSVRVDGEIQLLDGEPPHGAGDVESLLLTLMPARSHEALRSGVATEWMTDVDTVGRVRCLSFRDHRGPGAVFRLFRPVSAERLGLPSEVQSLVLDAGGLVLVAGSRQSGKRTVMSALVDLINRTRRDYIVTLEGEIDVVYDRGASFISQREAGADFKDVEELAVAALREDPDVLVIESIRTAAVVNVALEAAASGRLVIGGLQAPDVTAAVDYIFNLYSAETRCQVQTGLAEHLRGIVVQVPLRKATGGRLPAREVLLNTAGVASIIAEGRTSQLPAAIEAGRKQGMLPLNESLAAFVQSGAVDAREAYRHAADRPGFLATLKRFGLDTTAIDRLA